MLLAVGTKVKFKATGDEGVVTELLGGGMVKVYIEEDDMEIPTFVDNLIRPDEKWSSKPPVKGKIIDLPKEETPLRPSLPPVTQYAILKGKGIQLAFDPEKTMDGVVKQYQIYLLNDTRFNILFTFGAKSAGKHVPSINGKLESMSSQHVGSLLFDQLNDALIVTVDCWQITTEGTGPIIRKEIKIKPKQFFKKIITAPLLNKQVHLYKVIEQFQKAPSSEEDLKSYTKRTAQPIRRPNDNKLLTSLDLKAFAAFEQEIDLHLEKLGNYNKKMSNAEKLRLQLVHFDTYLAKAIKLGVARVFIIHGIGKGKLRDSIAERLIKHPDVITFKNEFHPKYGYGATEVKLME